MPWWQHKWNKMHWKCEVTSTLLWKGEIFKGFFTFFILQITFPANSFQFVPVACSNDMSLNSKILLVPSWNCTAPEHSSLPHSSTTNTSLDTFFRSVSSLHIDVWFPFDEKDTKMKRFYSPEIMSSFVKISDGNVVRLWRIIIN